LMIIHVCQTECLLKHFVTKSLKHKCSIIEGHMEKYDIADYGMGMNPHSEGDYYLVDDVDKEIKRLNKKIEDLQEKGLSSSIGHQIIRT
jgi:hypothetical protein